MVHTGNRDEFSSRLHMALRRAGKDGYGMGARLARAMRVTPKAASKWLNGEARPGHDRKVALARWLGIREEWLDYGRGEMLRSDTPTPPDADAASLDVREPSPTRTRQPSERSAEALRQIEQAVLSGEMDEADLLLLEQIARRLSNLEHQRYRSEDARADYLAATNATPRSDTED
ncbi:hypothetical protein [Salinicola lusitanus]|uniref:hypothetical protein n=1 Tax=Salinicola lusitanus TaxID=1949085 RepID=UPI000DA22D35|nr:hypothetical protein [Salinicola lusitanus]